MGECVARLCDHLSEIEKEDGEGGLVSICMMCLSVRIVGVLINIFLCRPDFIFGGGWVVEGRWGPGEGMVGGIGDGVLGIGILNNKM